MRSPVSRSTRRPFVSVPVLAAVALLGPTGLGGTALGQDGDGGNRSSDNEIEQPGEPAVDGDVSSGDANPDPNPEVPTPFEAELEQTRPDVIEQAGVGGPVAYGESGVLEVGGTGAVILSGGYRFLRLAPFVGWFVLDGLAVSLVNEVFIVDRDQDDLQVGLVGAVEASAHFPVNDRWLLFGAVGGGAIYNGTRTGGIVRPRFGVDVLIGRSGIFRPALYLSWASVEQLEGGGDVAGESLLFGIDFTYAAMF